MSAAAKSSSRRGRNDSPAPKAKAAAALKASEDLRKSVADAAARAAADAAKKAEEDKNICGFHPDAFKVIVLGPLAVVAVIGATLFLDVGKQAVGFVQMQWSTVSVPLGKFLTTNVDSIVILSALAAFSPLLLVGLVTVFRATMDLANFPLWQKALLGALVTTACATAYTVEGSLWYFDSVRYYWDMVSNPVEELLAAKTDVIIAGAAMCCLAPIGAALVMYLLRAVWNCRVKIVVEDVGKKAN